MTAGLAEWWGFRVRTPLGYDPPPVNRWERTAAGLLLATGLEVAWWLRLVLGPAPELSGFLGVLRQQVATPMVILLASVGLVQLLPAALVDRLGLSAILVVSREKGAIGRWDIPAAAAAVVIAAFATVQPWGIAAGLAALTGGAASLTLALFQRTVDFSKRRWLFELPEWLRALGEGDGGIVEPDADAQRLYALEIPGHPAYSVGVKVPPDVLEALRRINTAAEGTLYQRAPRAVVLLDEPPVDGTGREELRRLCRQVLSIVRHHGLTRLQSANLVLRFVQQAIAYGYDRDTTGNLPGGPFEEYGRFALETIHDGVGDCECTSILCASLLTFLGYEAALIHVVVVDGDGSTGHMAVGLSAEGLLAADRSAEAFDDCVDANDGSGRRFLYGETALDGTTRPFGEVPPEWKGAMKVESVVPLSGPSAHGTGPTG